MADMAGHGTIGGWLTWDSVTIKPVVLAGRPRRQCTWTGGTGSGCATPKADIPACLPAALPTSPPNTHPAHHHTPRPPEQTRDRMDTTLAWLKPPPSTCIQEVVGGSGPGTFGQDAIAPPGTRWAWRADAARDMRGSEHLYVSIKLAYIYQHPAKSTAFTTIMRCRTLQTHAASHCACMPFHRLRRRRRRSRQWLRRAT